MRAQKKQTHVSGAEDICAEDVVHKEAADLVLRALQHSRGKPDNITINVECLDIPLRMIRSLPVVTCQIEDEEEAQRALQRLLLSLGIEDTVITMALGLIYGDNRLTGAALFDSQTGQRLEPVPSNGIRVSRLGITQQARDLLTQQLETTVGQTGSVHRVIEAVVLASKVASARIDSVSAVIAELCVSDNPDYTTGYVASERFGYVRITHIKHSGDYAGGRVFFLKPDLSLNDTLLSDFIHYIERVPVIIDTISPIRGIRTIDEIIGATNS
ncbi:MAG: hypothetical protein HQL06_00600 [Nitrospirae bacterium]|nr:hypothetical protein [Nitrospirota bacterium]